jgi:hypothetical protein
MGIEAHFTVTADPKNMPDAASGEPAPDSAPLIPKVIRAKEENGAMYFLTGYFSESARRGP